MTASLRPISPPIRAILDRGLFNSTRSFPHDLMLNRSEARGNDPACTASALLWVVAQFELNPSRRHPEPRGEGSRAHNATLCAREILRSANALLRMTSHSKSN